MREDNGNKAVKDIGEKPTIYYIIGGVTGKKSSLRNSNRIFGVMYLDIYYGVKTYNRENQKMLGESARVVLMQKLLKGIQFFLTNKNELRRYEYLWLFRHFPRSTPG